MKQSGTSDLLPNTTQSLTNFTFRELVNQISDESAYVKSMISFNAEVVKQLKTQEANQLNSNADDIFSVWERERMNRGNNNYNITSRLLQDVNDDTDNKKYNSSLKKIR